MMFLVRMHEWFSWAWPWWLRAPGSTTYVKALEQQSGR